MIELGFSNLLAQGMILLATGEPTVDLGVSNYYLQGAILLFSVFMVAFFSSAEASLISVNKIRIHYLAEQGNKAAQTVNRVLEKHEKIFATILLTENAFIIFASSVGTAMAINLLGSSGSAILLAPLIMTVAIVIFREITPKTLAATHSDRWSLLIARSIAIVMFLETFVIFAFTLLPRLIMALMKERGGMLVPSVTEGELRMLINIGRAEGSVEASEAALLQKVFGFGDRQLREIMTPRPEVIWIERNLTLELFLALYAKHSHTRFPVYEGTMENVLGILSVKDVVVAMGEGHLQPGDWVTKFLRPAYFVPETKTISSTFSEMQQHGHGLAVTVDEFGGIAGLATLKQLLEVIVGAVADEGAAPEELYTTVDENTYTLDAGIGITEINEELQLELPEGEYQTVAGFLLSKLEYIPEAGEMVEYGQWKFTITAIDGVRIATVELVRREALWGDPVS